MRLLDTCLLSLSAASFIIGVHQIITIGFAQGYWLIMISSALFLWFSIRKRREPSVDPPPRPADQQNQRTPKRRTSKRQASSRRKKKSR